MTMRTAPLVLIRISAAALVTASLQGSPAPQARPAFFTFETDEFWLNLHHFLYLLGRAEAKMPDSTEAVHRKTQSAACKG